MNHILVSSRYEFLQQEQLLGAEKKSETDQEIQARQVKKNAGTCMS